jgi:uncharacterized membrane protein
MFPLGLFTMAVLFDVGDLMGGPNLLGSLAYWNIVGGLIGGVLTALASAVDLMFIARDSPGRRVGVGLTLVNIGVLVLFAVILMVRMRTPDRVASGGLLVIEVLSLAAAVYGAWFGGELVNRRPAGVFARAQAGHRNR